MSDEERARWDQRYAAGEYRPRGGPSPFLVEWAPRIPIGRALDVAAGAGRHALYLAEVGFAVDAIDVSAVAIDLARAEAGRRGLQVNWQVADLDDVDLPPAAHDLVTVFRYRSEALWPRLVDTLAPDGWLVVEHHLQTTLDVDGPPSDAFRLRPGELLEAFGSLRIVHYDERVEQADDPARRFALARLVACKGSPGF